MNDQERDELLVRLDERVGSIKSTTDKFEALETKVEKVVTDVKWLKGIGSSVVGIATAIAGTVTWFKHH